VIRPLHVDLDERASQLLFLPRRSRFASAQAHQQVLPADRLAWVKEHILRDSVALVEDAEHRDPLSHRSHAGLVRWPARGRVFRSLRRLLLLAPPTCGERQRDR